MQALLGPTLEDFELPKAAIFDMNGTLLDSGDLHALAWQEAPLKFGHDVSFEPARSQIGKGGDKLIPVFVSADEQRDHGKEMKEWRGNRFKTEYRPFSTVPGLLRRVRDAGLFIAIASSAKKEEVDKYLDIARITDLVDLPTSSDDAAESKPAPDIFEVVQEAQDRRRRRCRDRRHAVRWAAAEKIATIGVLCGGFTESLPRQAGCVEIYPGPAALFARFADSLLAR